MPGLTIKRKKRHQKSILKTVVIHSDAAANNNASGIEYLDRPIIIDLETISYPIILNGKNYDIVVPKLDKNWTHGIPFVPSLLDKKEFMPKNAVELIERSVAVMAHSEIGTGAMAIENQDNQADKNSEAIFLSRYSAFPEDKKKELLVRFNALSQEERTRIVERNLRLAEKEKKAEVYFKEIDDYYKKNGSFIENADGPTPSIKLF